MLRFVTSIKRKYRERLIIREKQWPYCHGEKLVCLDLVKGERGSVNDYAVNSQQRQERPIIKRTHLAYADLFTVKDGRKIVRKVLVEGDAGIGKTTLCTSIAEDWANDKLFQQFELLLLLPLRERKVNEVSSVLDLLELFHSRHTLCCSVYDYLEEVEGDKVLIVADGWDELNVTERHEGSFLCKLLFGKILPFASVMLTSRYFASASLHDLPNIDRFAEVRGFSTENIKEFILSEFAGDRERADSLLEQLERNPLVESVCSIPLSCAIVCHLWRTLKDALPATMTELYTKIVFNIVLRNVKKTFPEYADIILSLSNFNALPDDLQQSWQSLCEFSFQTMDQIVFTREELVKFLPHGLEKILCFGLLQSTQSILDVGLGVSFSFLHLTFQEYLAAFYLAQQPVGVQFQIFHQFAMSKRFDVTWRFFSGIISKMSKDEGILDKLFMILEAKYDPWTICHCLFEAGCSNVSRVANNFNWMCSFHPPLTAHDCSALIHIINHMEEGFLQIIFRDCGLRDEQIIALGQALSNKQGKLQIGGLDLSGNRITDNGMAAIFDNKSVTAFQLLQSLNLGANEIGPIGVNCILTLIQSTDSILTVLSLAHNPIQLSGLEALLNAMYGSLFINLKALSLRGSLNDSADVNATLLTSLAECLSGYCPQLEKLDISENNLGVPGARALNTVLSLLAHDQCKLKDFYHLIVTDVMFCCNALTALANCLEEEKLIRKAIHIDLSDNPIGLDGVAAVRRIIGSNQVCILQLARCQLTESISFAPLIISSSYDAIPSLALKQLDLDENNFTGDGICVLANLMHLCPAMSELSCSLCKITSGDLSRLISVLKSSMVFSNLGMWNLDGNVIDDGGVSILIEHLSLLFPNMAFLRLQDNLVSVQTEMKLSKMIEQTSAFGVATSKGMLLPEEKEFQSLWEKIVSSLYELALEYISRNRTYATKLDVHQYRPIIISTQTHPDTYSSETAGSRQNEEHDQSMLLDSASALESSSPSAIPPSVASYSSASAVASSGNGGNSEISIKLHQLDLLEGNGKTVRVIDMVASKWEKVALRLHFSGHDISRIERDHNKSVRACQTMFTEWLEGKGRKPVTWDTLIKALGEAELSQVARDLEIVLGTKLLCR